MNSAICKVWKTFTTCSFCEVYLFRKNQNNITTFWMQPIYKKKHSCK